MKTKTNEYETVSKIKTNTREKRLVSEINLYIDKTVPLSLLEQNIDYLKKKDSESLVVLLHANAQLRSVLFSMLITIEDLLNTSVYKMNGSSSTYWKDFMKDNKDTLFRDTKLNKKVKTKEESFNYFYSKLDSIDKSSNEKMSFVEIFVSLTYKDRVKFLKRVSGQNFRTMFKFKGKPETRPTRKEIVQGFEVSRVLRNYIVHNTYVYHYDMFDYVIKKTSATRINDSNKDKKAYIFDQITIVTKHYGEMNFGKKLNDKFDSRVEESIERLTYNKSKKEKYKNFEIKTKYTHIKKIL